MTPTIAMALNAGTAVASGIAGFQQAKGEQERAEINSYIGRTRAIQQDTVSRQNLNSEMGTLRTTFGANQQAPNVGTLEVVQELRDTRDRERRINYGNRMQEASDWRLAGRNASGRARGTLFTGITRAGPSLFDIYDYRTRNG